MCTLDFILHICFQIRDHFGEGRSCEGEERWGKGRLNITNRGIYTFPCEASRRGAFYPKKKAQKQQQRRKWKRIRKNEGPSQNQEKDRSSGCKITFIALTESEREGIQEKKKKWKKKRGKNNENVTAKTCCI